MIVMALIVVASIGSGAWVGGGRLGWPAIAGSTSVVIPSVAAALLWNGFELDYAVLGVAMCVAFHQIAYLIGLHHATNRLTPPGSA